MKELIALGVAAAILGIVCVTLRSRGLRAQACAVGYIVALVCLQLVMKQISSPPYSYQFPAWLTVLHYLTLSIACGVPFFKSGLAKISSWRRYCAQFAPIACSTPLCIVFNNQALVYLGAGINAVVGTLTPANTAVLQHFLGRRLARRSWTGITMAWVGGYFIAQGELSAAGSSQSSAQESMVITGLLYSFAALLLRSLKTVLFDRLISPRAYGGQQEGSADLSLSPEEALALQTPGCALVACCYASMVESSRGAWEKITPSVAPLLILSCVLALALNILGMNSIALLGATSSQMIGKLNIVVVMALSTAFLGEVMHLEVVAGTLLVLAGIWYFERAETKAKAEHSVLPKL
eukprot:TRINITY_DN27276_c0_g2_i1.p1 TRINITY_DN27276_c0_g2~~TRINITY_DN27276_c0_g2_i1.p1  ORF type:complete len:351 (+),score=42.60 TRINITY_DN27276_c0_g2_i1:90-1142(+)